MTNISRRHLMLAAGAAAVLAVPARSIADGRERPIQLILAPTNLGLRPNPDGSQPGTWRTPGVLMAAGLQARLGARDVTSLARPTYAPGEEPGTKLRNGAAIRAMSLELAHDVRAAITAERFPVVVGGDCSVLMGALYGARLAGARGLVHIDGHCDFANPANYKTVPGSAAGMDLALVTGRGEALLTQWPDVTGPLVKDADAVQVGERGIVDGIPNYYADIIATEITRISAQEARTMGVDAVAARVLARLRERKLDRAWVHLDLDVLDQSVMPAVDLPGSPGFDFAQLASLLGALVASGRIVGMNVTIYDPDRDPDLKYAKPIVESLATALQRRTTRIT